MLVRSLFQFLNCLERQVVSTIFHRCLVCRWEGSLSLWGSSLYRSATHWRSSNGSHATLYVESSDLVEPTSIIFMSIYIERYRQFFTHLNIKLFDTILTKETKHTLSGILSGHLNYILLRHPGVTCTL